MAVGPPLARLGQRAAEADVAVAVVRIAPRAGGGETTAAPLNALLGMVGMRR